MDNVPPGGETLRETSRPAGLRSESLAASSRDFADPQRVAEDATREAYWWASILRDVAYALRHQYDLSREEIAVSIERSLQDGCPDSAGRYRG